MNWPVLRQIEDLFCRWTMLRNDRIACGELRPSRHESSAFSEYVTLLEEADPALREEWNIRRDDVECRLALPRCDCGHARALHVEGSCYAVVGCSTACDCSRE